MKTRGRKLSAQAGRRPRRRGSVLIEASAVFVFFLLPVFLLIVQFGVYFNAANSLSQVSREAGRLTAIYGRSGDPSAPGSDNDVLIPRIREVAALSGLDVDYVMSHIAITPVRADRKQFQPAVVTVSYDLGKLSFLPVYKSGPITRRSTVMLEK